MDYHLLSHFQPKLLDAVIRDRHFWQRFNHMIFRTSTQLHVIGLVFEGKGTLQMDNQCHTLGAGSLFQIVPGMRMKICSDITEELVFYSVQFSGHLDIESNEKLPKLPFPLYATHLDWQPLSLLFRRIYTEWNSKKIGYEWRCKFLFYSILDEMIRLEQVRMQEDYKITDMNPIIDYINIHYNEPLNRERLAACANLSPSYFSTVFRQQTGYSPIQYVNKVRIDRAKQLLRSSSYSITDISSMVGYKDGFYFARIFSKATGFSPSEYRKA